MYKNDFNLDFLTYYILFFCITSFERSHYGVCMCVECLLCLVLFREILTYSFHQIWKEMLINYLVCPFFPSCGRGLKL